MKQKIPQEIIHKIIQYANEPLNYQSLFNIENYKQSELIRYNHYNAHQLFKLLYRTYKDMFMHIIDSDSSNPTELREFLNEYYGSYEEYYMIDFLACIADFKELEKNIIRNKKYSKYIKFKSLIKMKTEDFIKINRTFYCLTIEEPLYYAKTTRFMNNAFQSKNTKCAYSQYLYTQLNNYDYNIPKSLHGLL